jgi:hypothetical protein
MNIYIPDDEITSWQMRLDDIKRDLAVLDEQKSALQREQMELQRKIMSIDFLTNAKKLADSVSVGVNFGSPLLGLLGAKAVPGTPETDADPRNPNVRS